MEHSGLCTSPILSQNGTIDNSSLPMIYSFKTGSAAPMFPPVRGLTQPSQLHSVDFSNITTAALFGNMRPQAPFMGFRPFLNLNAGTHAFPSALHMNGLSNPHVASALLPHAFFSGMNQLGVRVAMDAALPFGALPQGAAEFFYKDSRMQHLFREEPKPNHSYIGLIAMGILSSKEQKMVLSEIYQWILDNYLYFRTRGPGWRNSIRHNLSLNDCFVKSGRSSNGKGHYWSIHPANLEDFKRGDFRRRRAQRKVRKAMGLACPDDEDTPSPSPSLEAKSFEWPSVTAAAIAAASAMNLPTSLPPSTVFIEEVNPEDDSDHTEDIMDNEDITTTFHQPIDYRHQVLRPEGVSDLRPSPRKRSAFDMDSILEVSFAESVQNKMLKKEIYSTENNIMPALFNC